MTSGEDRRFLAAAIDLARRGFRKTRPNPHVGCVIVRDGKVVGTGHHLQAGKPHAEAVALQAAGAEARGSTLYVNLEPCCHHGRTPPCSRAIVAAGVSRVVACHRDPNPLVAGGGFDELRRAGVTVETGALEEEALALNEGYLVSMALGRPFLILKAAQTLDGRLSASGGESKWITSPWARSYARELRGQVDAVAVGVGTVLADDPDLRAEPAPHGPAARIVLDSTLRTPTTARMLQTAGDAPVLIVTTDAAPEERAAALRSAGAEVLRVGAGPSGRVDLVRAARALAARGTQHVLFEGGGALHGTLLSERLVDRVLLFVAPRVLGGRDGTPLAERQGPVSLAEGWQVPVSAARRIGPDLLLHADLCDLQALAAGTGGATGKAGT